MNNSTNSNDHLAWIDALRAIAIIMVISVHTGHGLTGFESSLTRIYSFGGFGVQLFFIASALTLCISLQKNIGKPDWLLSYAARRYFRIAPMYYAGILIYFGWSFLKNYAHSGSFSAAEQYTAFNIVANLLFFHGFVPAAYNDVVPGGWSIAVETSFYVLFPLIFSIYKRYEKQRLLLSATLIAAMLGIVSVAQLAMGKTTDEYSFLFFNISNQLHVFIIGIYGYYSLESLRKLNSALLVAGSVALWLTGTWLFNYPLFNARFFSLAAYASCFVLFAALLAKNNPKNWLLGEIGRRSFSMYVLHFSVLNVIDYLFNVRFTLLGDSLELKAVLHLVVAIAATYVVAGYSKRHVEDRFIRFGATLVNRHLAKR